MKHPLRAAVSALIAGVPLLLGLLVWGNYQLALKLESIDEKVQERNDMLTDATYLPGAACVIAAGEETTPAVVVNYARSCAKRHAAWLTEQGIEFEAELTTD